MAELHNLFPDPFQNQPRPKIKERSVSSPAESHPPPPPSSTSSKKTLQSLDEWKDLEKSIDDDLQEAIPQTTSSPALLTTVPKPAPRPAYALSKVEKVEEEEEGEGEEEEGEEESDEEDSPPPVPPSPIAQQISSHPIPPPKSPLVPVKPPRRTTSPSEETSPSQGSTSLTPDVSSSQGSPSPPPRPPRLSAPKQKRVEQIEAEEDPKRLSQQLKEIDSLVNSLNSDDLMDF